MPTPETQHIFDEANYSISGERLRMMEERIAELEAEEQGKLSEMRILVKHAIGSMMKTDDPGILWVRFPEEDWRRLQELAGTKAQPKR